MKAIFICGPGRSGTTVAKKALGAHPDVATMPAELRLIVDPGGVLDLYEAVSRHCGGWDPYRADAGWERFTTLLWDLRFGGDRYQESALDNWVPSLFLKDLERRLGEDLGVAPTEQRWTGMATGRPFHYLGYSYDRAAALRTFVEDLYLHRNANATAFVDDTPYCGLHAKRTATVFPDKAFLLCVRHPLDILHSQLRNKGSWTPQDPLRAAWTIREVLVRTRGAIAPYTPSKAFILPLEKILEDPEGHMFKVCEKLRLPHNFEEQMAAAYSKDAAHVGRRKNLTSEERVIGERVLGEVCELFGYEL